MERIKPRAATLSPNYIDQHIERKTWVEESYPGGTHSWPFLPAKRDDYGSSGDTSGAQVPHRSSDSTVLAANCLSQAHGKRHLSYSLEETTEPPGVLDTFPELQDLVPFTGFRTEEPQPLFTPIPQPCSLLCQTPVTPGLSSVPHSSSPVPHVQPPVCYETDVNGMNRYYALREAPETHPNELCDSSKRNTIQGGNDAECPPKSSVTKIVRPLIWIHSKLSKRSIKPSVQEVSVQARQPLSSTKSADLGSDPQHSHPIQGPGQSPSPPQQTSRLDHNVPPFSSSSVRRLSITRFFGPTLCESVEDAILDPQSSAGVGPVLNASASSSSTSNQILGSVEPGCRRHPPRLRLQIPSPRPYVSPSHCYHPPRSASSPPARFTDPSAERHPDARLSLRGGCLPTPGRIDPSHRPDDEDGVPPVLWYLAGGRRMHKDQPGQPCYHGQPRPRRRFKNRRDRDEEDISQQRIPNDEPCEPLTFGHLRSWKQRSRPADRFDPQTGQVEPVYYRPFWQEFVYGASGGRFGR